MAIEEKYDEVKTLINLGKEKGYLLYDEVNDMLPSEVSSSEELDELFDAFGSAGIDVVEAEDKYKELKEAGVVSFGKDTEAVGVELDLTPGALEKTNDPVRMYLREMGTVPLLTREGEVEIAKRIERGQNNVLRALSRSRAVNNLILDLEGKIKANTIPIRDYVALSEEDINGETLEGVRKDFCKIGSQLTSLNRDLLRLRKRRSKFHGLSRKARIYNFKIRRKRIEMSRVLRRIEFSPAFHEALVI